MTSTSKYLLPTTGIDNGEDQPAPMPSTDGDSEERNIARDVLLTAVLVLIMLTTVIGNTFVCLSPLVSHRLRTATYTFLVSLASADLLLGLTVLPFSAMQIVAARWTLSTEICNIFVSCDVFFCTSSILHLLVISFDRHYAITKPYAYQRNMRRSKALVAIAVVWFISFLISFLPIHMGWNTKDKQVQNYVDPLEADTPHTCDLETNTSYALFDGIILFFIPLVVMTVLYSRIACIARRQAKAIRRLMVNSSESDEGTRDRTSKRSIDEHKATKIIAIVMGCFMICWVPYFTIFTFGPLFDWNVNPMIYNAVVWMGYLNSLVNPLVYALMIHDFRHAFKRLLYLCIPNKNGKRCSWLKDSGGHKSTNSATYAPTTANNTCTSSNNSNKKTQFSLKTNGFYSKILRVSNSTPQVQSEGV